MWEVEYTDEFETWWNTLTVAEQTSVTTTVDMLEARGVHLGYPHSSGVNGSRHAHMRELRVQHQGDPYRVLYAFTRAAMPSCSSVVTKPEMIVGTKLSFLLLTGFMTNIWSNSRKKVYYNGKTIPIIAR